MSVSGVDESAKQPPLLILIFPFYPPPPPLPQRRAVPFFGNFLQRTIKTDKWKNLLPVLMLLCHTQQYYRCCSVLTGREHLIPVPIHLPSLLLPFPPPLTPLPGPEASSQQKQITSSFQSAWISATNNSIINSDPGSSSDQSLYHCI